MRYFADEDKAHAFVQALRWPEKVCCPRCVSTCVQFISTRKRWTCKDCTEKKQFSVRVGTIFEDSKLPLSTWMVAVWMIVNAKNGCSSWELHRALGITQKSASFLGRRIRKALTVGSFNRQLAGEVEVDERFMKAMGGLGHGPITYAGLISADITMEGCSATRDWEAPSTRPRLENRLALAVTTVAIRLIQQRLGQLPRRKACSMIGGSSMASTLAEHLSTLRQDHWRTQHPYSADIQEAHRALHHPYATNSEAEDVIREWASKRQPCNFGKIGAKFGFIHFAFLREKDILAGDAFVAAKVAEEKRLWKQRAFQDLTNPPHSFMLVLLSPRIALAAPDDNLRRFAEALRDVGGWIPGGARGAVGAVSSDYLYLRHPTDGLCYGFQYNLDFFATPGDGRWWHDHRIPGGLAFTANSTGHMRHWQEWHSADSKGTDRGEWFVTQAMTTIANAHAASVSLPAATTEAGAEKAAAAKPSKPTAPGADGRVTWLLDLENGKALKGSRCPFSGEVPKKLQGKDWSAYAGVLHTDHAVRPEFFVDSETPPNLSRPYLMDFSYLHDAREPDFVKFMSGVKFTERDVYREIGYPEDWKFRAGSMVEAKPKRTPQVDAEIREAIEACRRWADSCPMPSYGGHR